MWYHLHTEDGDYHVGYDRQEDHSGSDVGDEFCEHGRQQAEYEDDEPRVMGLIAFEHW